MVGSSVHKCLRQYRLGRHFDKTRATQTDERRVMRRGETSGGVCTIEEKYKPRDQKQGGVHRCESQK